MKLYMSNKSKNVGTVAKAKIYLESVDSLALHSAHFIPCIFPLFMCVSCRSVAVCLEQCYGIVYI